MSILIPALADINLPTHVKILTTDSLDSLMSNIGRRFLMGYNGESFFGTAFIQGSRLQFTTAMPIQKMIEVSKIDRSSKKDSVRAVTEHSNRPQESAHGKQVRSYLRNTACTGDKFILPAFTFNYGVGLDEDAPNETLIPTDGAHRRSQIEALLIDSKVPEGQKDALKRNAVDVKIVFEDSRSDSHQDFADCGKAKTIPKSLVTTFDVRDERNRRSRELVSNSDFLSAYVDATAANVNLSAKSRMIWSMSAVRMFIAHVSQHHRDADLPESKKTEGAEEFFAALTRHLTQLKALDRVRHEPSPQETTGSLREQKGGDVALRGIGMAIFARAFLSCKEEGMGFDEMAARLAKIDWHVLKCEKGSILLGPSYAKDVLDNAQPIWSHLIVMRDSGYRISSSSNDADAAWKKIREEIFSEARAA